MNKLDEQQKRISNKDVDWAKHYDYYEVELRDMYRTVSKPQNDSHFEMLKRKGASFLKKDKTFCEIGFSAGLTLRYALGYFGKVYGLDISPKNVELTEKELKAEGYSNFELYTSDLMIFDERFKSKFDVISFIHGLEHFTSDDYPIIFNNIKKYLKPYGVFTGALPFKNLFNYRMCPDCMRVFEIDGHVSSHDINSLKKVFNENGFEIIHLDNFNLKFVLKYGGFLKNVYIFTLHYILNKHSNSQLEYIVKPRIMHS
jgi:ubiquinone/menaquinone biosynthesis C-methylase UbiE